MPKQAISATPNDQPWDWNLPKLFIKRCREKGSKTKISDSTGISLSGHDLLIRTLVVKRILTRMLAPDEKCVGVLLPPTVPGAVTNFALTLGNRVAVNLNYTVSDSIINSCVEQAGIRRIITSSRAIEKFGLKPKAEMIFLEDLKEKAIVADKVAAVLIAKVLPQFMVNRSLKLNQRTQEDLLTYIFTSGSTGNPKGVPLTMLNVASNIQGFDRFIRVLEKDNFLGVLPFFHSFGFTVTLWGAMTLPSSACYHFNPLEPRQIGKLVEANKTTVVLGTPTFVRTYARRIEPEQFKTVEVVVVGAEKMPLELFDIFEKQFGVRPIEGYGATETSPVACVNLPPSRATTPDPKAGVREGSVGRPIPGVTVRVVSLDDGAILETNQSGMIQISGPNIMSGYLGQPELSAKVLKDGWYITGDLGYIDDDGFVFVTGRQSRFSKIGGEMVPHIQIEEAITQFVGDNEGQISVAVTSVPDEKKGERLIVLHTEISKTPAEIMKALSELGLPNLFIPSQDSFIQVDAIPILGTGKLDLRGLQQMAKDLAK
ncbi:MAG: AMP-binding protein [Pirellula sp.]|jgi:acyl-[acyl-carrier-protein]-phospholipid O-acyltransferase/long-chain-fatty-acid--[acyl-carrier-protein] ligase|nr:AMP-binding protein [Pirellula sp.]